MKNLVLFFVAVLSLTSALNARAQVRPPRPPLPIPVPIPTPPPAPGPGSAFTFECEHINWINGNSGYGFECVLKGGERHVIAAARTYDLTGTYAVGFEQATGFSLQDIQIQTGISSAVSTFFLLKEGQPNHPAKLRVTGIISKLPSSLGKVATTAAIIQ